ncbi:glutathione S-transferase [Pestalotiopsis sp. NC0098]|nr:glutathione S-transferase [Pestalotiopsis sp. NC0098]
MSDLKPIVLHGHDRSANPWKVVIILEELGLPYKHIYKDMTTLKQEPFVKINPNGRVPAIEDPNTGITLWESGAIIEYLVETYDKDHKISSASSPEKFLEKQFLHFQVSGQGPYYGQWAWFKIFHKEQVPSALERYEEQTLRVIGVLDNILEGKDYLVGDKVSYADLAFITWESVIQQIFFADRMDEIKAYKNYWAWYERLNARPAVQKANKLKAEAIAESSH